MCKCLKYLQIFSNFVRIWVICVFNNLLRHINLFFFFKSLYLPKGIINQTSILSQSFHKKIKKKNGKIFRKQNDVQSLHGVNVTAV